MVEVLQGRVLLMQCGVGGSEMEVSGVGVEWTRAQKFAVLIAVLAVLVVVGVHLKDEMYFHQHDSIAKKGQ